ncbi:FAD-binding protein [Sulfolobus acidocaldarius]|uniref:Conserved protein n=4 Tax=Sulfolobus acidocaldarius TaxID=2285 RepID=Q4J9J4_SULAC|nr:FAD-binding protein [Sulfolobus acidocaldarius]AAY80536.1 conserved protein [Sulfolobus acidocaldarius DSM 639]AGE71125.1 hypothetical protein SacN8_05800 [Sulfolobus acidocaldarius N8]AGE73395.1 hypothetical protein SacRon12I_05795 [Sulfolobus acidocaldarius Ron12/I]ALU28601.1 FAD-binding protein [Sulfolobus acidocaldarius]ALU31315.1 FAD-binding protein [Sulfolobus acidocaldarius]
MDIHSEEELFRIIRSAYLDNKKIQVLGYGRHGRISKVDEYVYTKNMNWYEIKDGKVQALAGADVTKIRKEASENGLLLPTLYDGTIGGLLAINPISPLTTSYGRPSDFTLWTRFLTPYGGMKWKVFVGSMGLLGAISRAELKLFEKPRRILTYDKNDATEEEIMKVSSLRPLVLLVEYDGRFNVHASFSEEVLLQGFSVDEGVPMVEVDRERDEIIVEGDDTFESFKKIIELSNPSYAYWIYNSKAFVIFDADVEKLSQFKYYSRDRPKEIYLKLKKLLDVKNIFN